MRSEFPNADHFASLTTSLTSLQLFVKMPKFELFKT